MSSTALVPVEARGLRRSFAPSKAKSGSNLTTTETRRSFSEIGPTKIALFTSRTTTSKPFWMASVMRSACPPSEARDECHTALPDVANPFYEQSTDLSQDDIFTLAGFTMCGPGLARPSANGL